MKKRYTYYHKNGSIWAKGFMDNKTMAGYWQWFRKDGTKLRSGYFKNGIQTGEWITYDKKGNIYKKTIIKE